MYGANILCLLNTTSPSIGKLAEPGGQAKQIWNGKKFIVNLFTLMMYDCSALANFVYMIMS